jgi:transketolase N-terminal domain/subunit
MNIIIGKPFGADAYYYVWKKIKWIKSSKKLSYGIKHTELDFVNFSEETLGNSLGVAAGIALGNYKKTWVNLSDAALQMGPTLEAIQFIGYKQLPIIVTIDYNSMQLTGNLRTKKQSIKKLFESFDWNVFEIKDKTEYYKFNNIFRLNGPTVILVYTKKGDGVKEMEDNPIEWHYKTLKDIREITISPELKDLGFFTSLGYVE